MEDYSYAQSHRVKKEREYWTKLRELANNDKVREFYILYAEYLEWNNILSNDRKAIYKMAKRVVELLEKTNEKLFNI